tara:strand:+ start:604 stop:2436 length:1833 start_codon:yes stop_codon:yes gene_type:complete
MFRSKSDAIRIGQDSFKLPSTLGVQFTSSGIMRFDIPRNAGFIDMSNSYLEMEILLENPTGSAADLLAQPMTSLERDCGAQSIISQLTIRSQGRVLEELRNYNTFAKLHYNSTHSEGAMNRRSKLEGCAPSYMPKDNVYFTKNEAIPPVAASTLANGITAASNNFWRPIRRKVCLPLLGGVFQSPKSFPAMVLPTEIEIILEDALKCMRVANHGDGLDTVAGLSFLGGEAAGVERQQIFISPRAVFNAPGGQTAAGIVPDIATVISEGEYQINQLHNCWFRPGMQVLVSGTGQIAVPGDYGPEGLTRTIGSVKVMDSTAGAVNGVAVAGHICVTFTAEIVTGAAVASNNILISQIPAAGNYILGAPGYTVFNPTLVVQKVIPPPQVVQQISSAIARGEYNQDIISYTCLDNAIPSQQTTSTNIISADLSRVKSIISVPTSQANVDSLKTSNATQGLYLNSTQAQYQINNKLVPDRRINLVVEGFPLVVQTPANQMLRPYRIGSFMSGIHRWECEKTLRSSNINLSNTNFITNNPANFQGAANNFNATEPGSWFVGRSLGAGVGTSQNLVGKSVMLYLDYNANSNVVKLLRNFIVHVRTISIGMQGVSIFT